MSNPFSQLGAVEKLAVISIIIIVIAGSAYFFLSPKERIGTWRYGACAVFLEQQVVRFPHTIKTIAVNETRVGAKILFSHTNPYGFNQTQILDCIFNRQGNETRMARATLDRQNVPEEWINRFNLSIPSTLANLPDLHYPARPPVKIEDLKP